MTENISQLIAILKLLFVVGYATLYAYGGISGKWKRRIIGSIYLTLGIVGFSLWQRNFSWWYLLCALLLYGGTSIGYGADRLQDKLIKRTYCGAAYACWCLPLVIINQVWHLFFIHCALCMMFSIYLGVFNPCKDARDEETLIGFNIGLIPLYMIGV